MTKGGFFVRGRWSALLNPQIDKSVHAIAEIPMTVSRSADSRSKRPGTRYASLVKYSSNNISSTKPSHFHIRSTPCGRLLSFVLQRRWRHFGYNTVVFPESKIRRSLSEESHNRPRWRTCSKEIGRELCDFRTSNTNQKRNLAGSRGVRGNE